MLTKTLTKIVPVNIALAEACLATGIPYKVRPVWGSARDNEHAWVCPLNMGSGWNTTAYICPEVQNNTLIFWEGQCHFQGHTHGQYHTILDVQVEDQPAILIQIQCYSARNPFLYFTRVLVGMDDGHPFVHIVPRYLDKVQDAFDWLTPKPVWVAKTLGHICPRQGEWFFVPYTGGWKLEYPEMEFPNPPNRRIKGERFRTSYRSRFFFDAEADDVIILNGPIIDAIVEPTRHFAERIIYRSNHHHLVMGDITAPDHPILHLDKWHSVYHNRRTQGGRGNGGPE